MEILRRKLREVGAAVVVVAAPDGADDEALNTAMTRFSGGRLTVDDV